MRLATILLMLSLSSCAHMPKDLIGWAQDKGLRLATCAAQKIATRGDAKACIGPNFIRDLGTAACAQAHTYLEALPV